MPRFLREALKLRQKGCGPYFSVEVTLLNALKMLVQSVDPSRQYFGFILASVILDPSLASLEEQSDLFNRSIANPLLQSISNVFKKKNVLSTK